MGNVCDSATPSADQNKGKAYATGTPAQKKAAPVPQMKGSSKGKVGMPAEGKQAAIWASTGIVGLRERRLKELPAMVEAVAPSIKVLDCGCNQLSTYPLLDRATALQRVVLSSNLIAEINGRSLLAYASTLKILLLDGNQLKTLPDEFSLLIKLERLNLSNNKLQGSLPSVVGSLPSLILLDLSRNQLSSLPDELAGLENLEDLDASDNQLSNIPPSFGSLHKLKTLNLDKCLIQSVPSEVFIQCVSLQTLSLHSNPIKPETVQETEGFGHFEKRRQEKFTKGIVGGIIFGGPRGLDEGLDRKLKDKTTQIAARTSSTWASAVPDAAAANNQSQTNRAYARLSVYKGKAVMQLSFIPPTWVDVVGDKGGITLSREGAVLLEFANVSQGSGQQTGYGDRSYDWDNKLSFAMKSIEACNLLDTAKVNNNGFSLIHDPSIGTANAGQVTKTFGVKPNADGLSWAFTLNQTANGTKTNVFVPVSAAEMLAIQNVVQFAIPKLMGFDVVLTAPIITKV